MRKGIARIVLVLAAMFFLAACSGQPLSTREKGTLFGGVVGAGTGYVVGNALQNTDAAIRHTQAQLSSQQRQIAAQRAEIRQLQQEREVE